MTDRSRSSPRRRKARGLLVVLSGPSGAGKTTLVRRIVRRDPRARFSVSATTRPRRPGERHGRDYFFLSPAEFARSLARGELLEHATVYGHRYGTPKSFVERHLAAGRDVLLDIDVQGGMQVRRRMPEAVLVFLLPGERPGSWERTLRARLAHRGTEARAEVERRLSYRRGEIAKAGRYDYVVVNDRLERAGARVEAIRLAEHCRAGRKER